MQLSHHLFKGQSRQMGILHSKPGSGLVLEGVGCVGWDFNLIALPDHECFTSQHELGFAFQDLVGSLLAGVDVAGRS